MKKAWARKQKGFTIVELVVVMIVIGILASIVMITFTTVQQRNRDSQRDRDITEVQRALDKYYAANGIYPSANGGAGADGTAYDISTLATALTPTYLATMPTPPSSNPYQYTRGAPATASYGINMGYESKPNCQRGTNNQGSTWWSSLAVCIQ
jgi:type II secretion system protein G